MVQFREDVEPPDNDLARYVAGTLTKPSTPNQNPGAPRVPSSGKKRKRKPRREGPDVFIVSQLGAYLDAQRGLKEQAANAAVQQQQG